MYTAEGNAESGEKSEALFAESVKALHTALDIFTKKDFPQDWAQTEDNLGSALSSWGQRGSGEQATKLFAEGVQAYRAALEVYTKADLPQGWAGVEDNLGNALSYEGNQSSGERAAELFAQAVQAHQAALEVRSKETSPQDWARTQTNLGSTYASWGGKSSGDQAKRHFAEAATAQKAALEVYTKAAFPQYWANAQESMGDVLTGQGEWSSGEQAALLFAQAVHAYEFALEVYTKADLPQYWAWTQSSLANTLIAEAEHSSGDNSASLTNGAMTVLLNLEDYAKANSPQALAMNEINIGRLLADQGKLSAATKSLEEGVEKDPANPQCLQNAAGIYHSKLFRYDRAYELTENWLKVDSSTDAKLTMVEAELTTSRYDECIKRAKLIDDVSLSPHEDSLILVRDTAIFACQWGAGRKEAALLAADALVKRVDGLQKTGWEFAGTRHYLASSPAFESGRASWIALFQSLEDGDGAAMKKALQQLEEVMKH
jgi:tetratricopeptide (TPR) repeat protein